MTLHRGEIVGLGGLHGQGQSDFLRALYGALAVVGGTIEVGGTRFDPTGPLAAMRRSLAYVSGERARYGIMAIRTIFENLVLTLLIRDRQLVVGSATPGSGDLADRRAACAQIFLARCAGHPR